MSNQKAIWQETYASTRKNMRTCLLVGVAGFWLAGTISTVYSTSSAISYIQNNLTVFGMLLFAVGAFGIFLSVRDAKMTAPKNMNQEEYAKHTKSLHTMRGFGVWFTMLAVICNILTPNETLMSYFFGSILSASVFATSLAFLGLSLLCQKMASSIKVKYL